MQGSLYTRSLMAQVSHGLFLAVLLSLSLANALADNTTIEPGQQTSPSNVMIFEVAPVQRAAAILAPNAQTPPPPAPLESEIMAQVFEAIGIGEEAIAIPGAGADSDSVTSNMVLSAKQPFHEGQGVLTLALPYTVHPETGVHFRGSHPGSAGVKIHVKKGNKYLLDFLVRSAVPGVYKIATEGGAQDIEDPNGGREHLVLALNASSSGWTTVRLKRPDSDFFLYSVEVTELK